MQGSRSLRMSRLAIIASHPIQYHTPWYRALSSKMDIHVFYAYKPSAQEHAAAGFNVPFEWDIPLLHGYPFTWLENKARQPGVDHFWGCNTPAIHEIIQRGDFEAILVHGWNLFSFWQATFAGKNRGIPVLVRGDSHLGSSRKSWKKVTKFFLYPPMLRKFDAFLSVGQHHSEYLKKYGVPDKRIFQVPHFVDNDFFRKNAEKARQSPGGPRRRFGIGEDKVVFLFVGKFIPQKRPFDFLLALDALKKQGTNAWGLMIGNGPLRPLLDRHARELGTPCSFGGFLNQKELGFAYGAADVLVLPSDRRETWGLVVNEAMASGLPAIVSNRVGCVPDLIIEGKTGFSYPCGRIDGLMKHMRRMIEDRSLLTGLSTAAVAHVQAYSIEAGCAGLIGALEFVQKKGPAA
jgi:glycosyltransferase involved in cell wall biosynthesis